MQETDWLRLIRQLRNGDCTPFLGAGITHGTLPTGAELSRKWAETYQYPFSDDTDLARVLQFAATTAGDTVYVKELVAQELSATGDPDFAAAGEPHTVFAAFPFPVFLTTNYDDFMERALLAAGKRPSSEVFPWHETRRYDQKPFDGTPHPDEPLVYHLHGRASEPRSLVLTEDDYLEFLTSASGVDISGGQLLPTAVLKALSARPLLFLGYSLHDWSFRVLFHALLRNVPAVQRRRHVSVQLPPAAPDDAARSRASDYLSRYLENLSISVYWGSVHEFCEELRERMGSLP